MYTDVRLESCHANRRLAAEGLVTLTWGNASVRDGDSFAIKPSGVAWDEMTPDDMVVVDIASGAVIEGERRPSTDTPTHAELYRHDPDIGAIVHVHSPMATAFAQARRRLRCLGTTHADHFAGDVPITRVLTPAEVADDYEGNTGRVIIEQLADGPPDGTKSIPAVLVAGHAPFVWGPSATEAVDNAVSLEACAAMAVAMFTLEPSGPALEPWVLAVHHQRKHGPDAYYGQKGNDR